MNEYDRYTYIYICTHIHTTYDTCTFDSQSDSCPNFSPRTKGFTAPPSTGHAEGNHGKTIGKLWFRVILWDIPHLVWIMNCYRGLYGC